MIWELPEEEISGIATRAHGDNYGALRNRFYEIFLKWSPSHSLYSE